MSQKVCPLFAPKVVRSGLLAPLGLCLLILSSPFVQAESTEPDWQLVFSDDFEREELGPDWKAKTDNWEISDGMLVKQHPGPCGEIVLTRPIRGLQRVEFEAVSSGEPGDLSVTLHGRNHRIRSGDELIYVLKSGYFLQFGGRGNAVNQILRMGETVATDKNKQIEKDKVHHIVAEFDGTRVRMTVDGDVVLEYEENDPLLGGDHEHLTFYISRNGAIRSVKVFSAGR